jgi:hypothetical protein
MGHAEHTLHRADGAADARADCTPDHPAHRASYPVALISTLLRAADDALGMTERGDKEYRQRNGDSDQLERRPPSRIQACTLSFACLHLDSSKSGGESPSQCNDSFDPSRSKVLFEHDVFEKAVIHFALAPPASDHP